ncbi:MAG: O-antigen ligase family protein [Candidatus Hodarchaeota archaeon]
MIGLLFLALVFIPHSFPLAGAGGWNLIDLLLPFFAVFYVIKAIIQDRLYYDMRSSSILPFLFLLGTMLHIFTDPRLGGILRSVTTYNLPVGGFRIYYDIAICTILYYTTPLIIDNWGTLRRFLKIYVFIVFTQIIVYFSRLIFGIYTLPWDTYGSKVLKFDESSIYYGGTRYILLGKMGLYLFTYAITILNGKRKTRIAFIILASLALIVSGGRATLFSGLFIACLFLAFRYKNWCIAVATGLCVVLVVAIFSFSPSSLESMPSLPRRYLSVLSPKSDILQTGEFSRIEMWGIQLYALKRHPLWGSTNDFPRNADERALNAVMRGDTHNVYLGTASRFGLPMFMIWLLFIARQMRRSYFVMKKSHQNAELHSISLWLFLSLSGYLPLYITGGGAGIGFTETYVLFALVDIVHRLAYEQNSLIHESPRQVKIGNYITKRGVI